jgi:hypothetical protein
MWQAPKGVRLDHRHGFPQTLLEPEASLIGGPRQLLQGIHHTRLLLAGNGRWTARGQAHVGADGGPTSTVTLITQQRPLLAARASSTMPIGGCSTMELKSRRSLPTTG